MVYLVYTFSAFLFVNGIPHFVQGVCGHRFQSPFASPPGRGESSPLINVLWGNFNFLLGYLLLNYAGFFAIGQNLATYVFFSAVVVSSIILAIVFGKIRKA